MKGVEPSSSAWKAEIISRYMTSAKDVFTILILRILVKRLNEKNKLDENLISSPIITALTVKIRFIFIHSDICQAL